MESKMLSSPSQKLSPEGQKLAKDFRNVVEKAKLLLLTKNDGNLLQDFIWQCQQLEKGNFNSPNAPVDKQTAKQHGDDALAGLRTLGTLIITNGQFRKLRKLIPIFGDYHRLNILQFRMQAYCCAILAVMPLQRPQTGLVPMRRGWARLMSPLLTTPGTKLPICRRATSRTSITRTSRSTRAT